MCKILHKEVEIQNLFHYWTPPVWITFLCFEISLSAQGIHWRCSWRVFHSYCLPSPHSIILLSSNCFNFWHQCKIYCV